MVFQPLTAIGLSNVEPQDTGAASGLVNVAQQVGASMGLALLSTVFEATYRTSAPAPALFAHAISYTIAGSAIFLTSALLVVLLMLQKPAGKLQKA